MPVVPHYDARETLHDPSPQPRPAAPLLPPVTIAVEQLAVRLATAIGREAPAQWSVLKRLYVDRLLDYLEERHKPAEVDVAVERFVEALRVHLPGNSAAPVAPWHD